MKNDFVAQAYQYLHDWWRYLVVGLLAVVAATQIGSLPLIAAIAIKASMEGDNMLALFADQNAIMTYLDSNLTLFLMLLSFAIGLLVLWLIVKYVHKQPWVSLTTSRPKTDWGRVFFAFALVASFTIVFTLIDYYTNPQDYVLQFEMVPFLILAIISIVMIPLQTSLEEYLFRGYFMQGLGVLVGNRWLPLIITSSVFGLLHFANPEVDKIGPILMIYYIGTGLFLGIITLMDEGMELALGFHAGNNMIAAMLVTADWTVFQTNSIFKDISEPSAGIDIIAPVFIIYPIFIGIMAYKYKWKNWGQKLFGKVEKPVAEEIDYTAV